MRFLCNRSHRRGDDGVRLLLVGEVNMSVGGILGHDGFFGNRLLLMSGGMASFGCYVNWLDTAPSLTSPQACYIGGSIRLDLLLYDLSLWRHLVDDVT